MKKLHLIDAGKLAEFLEKEIAAGRNPSSPEDWDALISRMAEQGEATFLGEVPNAMDGQLVAANLREEGLKVKVMRFDKEDKTDGTSQG